MEENVKKDIETLKKLGLSKPGFNTPENYFEEFSDALFTKITEDSLPKATGFEVPDTYFENLEASILSTVENSTHKRKSKVRFLYTISGVAAALLLYMGVAKYNQSTIVTFDSITITDIQDYIEDGNMNIDSYTIASVDENIDLNGLFDDSISDQEISDYLNSQDTEFLFIDN